jgi:hypothetical protein
MITRHWSELWLTAVNPVFYKAQPFIDLQLFNPKKFSALQYLENYSELEILILAWCIIQSEDEDYPEAKYVSSQDFESLFENALYSTIEIEAALIKLVNKQWLDIDVIGEGDEMKIIVWAELNQLEKDKLYTPNKWSHLSKTGVYKLGICSN